MKKSDDVEYKWLNEYCPDGGFLQSDEWRVLKTREGFTTQSFHFDDIHAHAIEHQLPLVDAYWYIPKGPVFVGDTSSLSSQTKVAKQWRSILEKAKKSGAKWIRVEPKNTEEQFLLAEWSKPFSMQKARDDVQPREIFVVDISRDEMDILSAMKSKTRYNIRLAEKKGVYIARGVDADLIREFLRMATETARRKHISVHPERHYQELFQMLSRERLELFTAYRNGRAIAAVSIIFFGKYATYLHGVSSDDERDSMAPYLLQWEAMREAKRRGCVWYDFGGVDTRGLRESLVGITRFKQGFAQNVNPICFPGSFDVVFSRRHYKEYLLLKLLMSFVKKTKYLLTK